MHKEKTKNKSGKLSLIMSIIIVLMHIPLVVVNRAVKVTLNEYDFYSIVSLQIVILMSMIFSMVYIRTNQLSKKVMKVALAIHIFTFVILIVAIFLSGGA